MAAAVVWFILGWGDKGFTTKQKDPEIPAYVSTSYPTERDCLTSAKRYLESFPKASFVCVKGVRNKADAEFQHQINKTIDDATKRR